MKGSQFRLCDVTQTYQICINTITSVLLHILTLFASKYILLLKIVDFENIEDLRLNSGLCLLFKNIPEVKQNFKMAASIGLIVPSRNFDIWIAITFLFYMRF